MGYSAGAYSVFQQLAHELYRGGDSHSPDAAAGPIIRRVAMLSNGPDVRPKSLTDQQRQFDELLRLLDIPAHLSAAGQLAELRRRPWQDLVAVQGVAESPGMSMTESEFRPWADGDFYSLEALAGLDSGDFSRRVKDRGISLLTGECEREHTVYVRWRTPANSYAAVLQRLRADYGHDAATRILSYYCGGGGSGKNETRKDGEAPPELPAGYSPTGRTYSDGYTPTCKCTTSSVASSTNSSTTTAMAATGSYLAETCCGIAWSAARGASTRDCCLNGARRISATYPCGSGAPTTSVD